MMQRVLFSGLLYGHLLGVADEDGNVQLIDSRKSKASSIVKGTVILLCACKSGESRIRHDSVQLFGSSQKQLLINSAVRIHFFQ